MNIFAFLCAFLCFNIHRHESILQYDPTYNSNKFYSKCYCYDLILYFPGNHKALFKLFWEPFWQHLDAFLLLGPFGLEKGLVFIRALHAEEAVGGVADTAGQHTVPQHGVNNRAFTIACSVTNRGLYNTYELIWCSLWSNTKPTCRKRPPSCVCALKPL